MLTAVSTNDHYRTLILITLDEFNDAVEKAINEAAANKVTIALTSSREIMKPFGAESVEAMGHHAGKTNERWGLFMICMGFVIQSGNIKYAVLKRVKDNIELLEKNRIIVPDFNTESELMNWMETELDLLIKRIKPDKIAYRTSLNLNKMVQVVNIYYAQGILHLVAFKNEIGVMRYLSQSLTPNKLGLPKGTDLYNHIDERFGKKPPYWDKNMKEAVMICLFELSKGNL